MKKEVFIKRENYTEPVGRSPFLYAGFTCNNNCIFCFEKDQKHYDRGLKNLKKELDVIRTKFDFVNIMGQEPTMRKDIFELINYANKLKFKQVGIASNGRLLAYAGFTYQLIATGIDQIAITVMGHNAKMHDWHTLSPGSFNQTLQGIKNAIAIKETMGKAALSLLINLMVTGKNFKYLPSIVKFYLDLGIQEINIGHILPFNKIIRNSRRVVAKMSDVAPYLMKIQDDYGFKAKFLFVEYPPCVFPVRYRHLSFPCMEESPQKVRLALCGKCPHNQSCAGIHKYYLDLYGDKEFKI